MSEPLVNRDGEAIGKGRISPALRSAVSLMVTDGLSVADAAKRTGYQLNSLQVALRKPHVRVLVAAVRRAWMEGRTSQAWLNIADLADRAASEDVRLKANKVFLEAAGELGAGGAGGDQAAARTLVQIILAQAPAAGHPPSERLPGVVERQTDQQLDLPPSNYRLVGRGESDAGEEG
jgi:hypothetical protein